MASVEKRPIFILYLLLQNLNIRNCFWIHFPHPPIVCGWVCVQAKKSTLNGNRIDNFDMTESSKNVRAVMQVMFGIFLQRSRGKTWIHQLHKVKADSRSGSIGFIPNSCNTLYLITRHHVCNTIVISKLCHAIIAVTTFYSQLKTYIYNLAYLLQCPSIFIHLLVA